MEGFLFVIVPIGICLLFLFAIAKGQAQDKRIAYGLAIYFLLTGIGQGIAMLYHCDVIRVFCICLPLGGFSAVMGLGMVIKGLHYQKKTEGQFMGTKHGRLGKGNIEYHSLVFRYSVDDNLIQGTSNDHYKPTYIRKRFQRQETYPIWVNSKNPEDFRVKRFYHLGIGLFAVFIGLALLWVPFDMLMPKT